MTGKATTDATDASQSTLAPSAAALTLARQAVRDFAASCFWFRDPDAPVSTIDDVLLVIEHLRNHGDRKAWHAAQSIRKCL